MQRFARSMIRPSLLCKTLCLLILVVLSASGLAQQGSREIMANAMARMMEAMGLFDSAPAQQGFGSASPDAMSMMGPLTSWGSTPGLPWGSSVGDPSRSFRMREMMEQFARSMARGGESGDWDRPWKPSRLEGVWEGRDGELLIIQGNRFRIYSPGMERVDGLIEVRDERLALYNPLDENAQPFEFAESQGRLVMRDLNGQVYLYRRLRLDGGRPQPTTRARPDR